MISLGVEMGFSLIVFHCLVQLSLQCLCIGIVLRAGMELFISIANLAQAYHWLTLLVEHAPKEKIRLV